MPVAQIRIAVADGDAVVMPVAHLQKANFIQTLLKDDQADSDVLDVDMSRGGTKHSLAVISAVAKYAAHFGGGEGLRPATIPKPLCGSLDRYISDWEKDFIKSLLKEEDNWQHEDLVEVLNVAYRLEFESLRDLLSGWVATQIDELVKDKNMMDGAEAVRNFFNMPNEWDADSMEHLKAEMEFYQQNENN